MRSKLIMVLALVVVLIVVLLGVSDSKAFVADARTPIADTGVADNEIATSGSGAESSHSANATITIIMRTPPLPEE